MNHATLVEVTRGGEVECVHAGSVAVVDAAGKLLWQAGDPDWLTFTRSTLKPFQALPLVESGGLQHFGFTGAETALLCASHSGEPMHLAAVESMLGKAGCDAAHLRCGCHVPLRYAALGETPPAGERYTPLHNNCSGKHAGFLAWCVRHGAPLDGYLDPAHPLQQAVRDRVAACVEMSPSALKSGIDGCSAPNYAMPLSRLAHAYAKLAASPENAQGTALETLYRAMTAHPEMVSGAGRGDLAFMRSAPGDRVAKAGADGVQAIGVRSAGIGIAIKIADGNARALLVAAVEVLRQIGLLDRTDAVPLAGWARPRLTSLAGLPTGEVRPAFRLEKA
ncbi:MAG: asparaginase [Burkholderiaceae bacterium]